MCALRALQDSAVPGMSCGCVNDLRHGTASWRHGMGQWLLQRQVKVLKVRQPDPLACLFIPGSPTLPSGKVPWRGRSS